MRLFCWCLKFLFDNLSTFDIFEIADGVGF